MKYRKERDFVKRMCDELHFEVIVSRITILESGEEKGKVNYVMFEDRFGEQYILNNYRNKPKISKYERK